jgi:hypothetical protein
MAKRPSKKSEKQLDLPPLLLAVVAVAVLIAWSNRTLIFNFLGERRNDSQCRMPGTAG